MNISVLPKLQAMLIMGLTSLSDIACTRQGMLMDNSQLEDRLRDRMLAYQFLAHVYRAAPDSAFIDSLLAMDVDAITPLSNCVEVMKSRDPEDMRIELEAEYNRVFLGMSPDPIAPYESVYTSPEHLLMQDARDEVAALYLAESLTLPGETRIPEDHIAFEFDYMAFLCGVAAQACAENDQDKVAEYRDKQRDFLEKHLLRWIPAMCQDMKKRVRTDFYRSICDITMQQLELVL